MANSLCMFLASSYINLLLLIYVSPWVRVLPVRFWYLSLSAVTWCLLDSAYSLYISVRMSCLALLCKAIDQNSFIYQTIKATQIQKDIPHHVHWVPNRYQCSGTKSFHNSSEGNITKIYLLGEKLTVRVSVHCPLHVLGTRTKYSRKKGLRMLFLCTYSTRDHTQGGPVS